MNNDKAFTGFEATIILMAFIVIATMVTYVASGLFAPPSSHHYVDIPSGYVSDCNAIRDSAEGNVYLSCVSKPKIGPYNNEPQMPQWIVYVNKTRVDQSIETNLPSIGNRALAVIPCKYPSEIRVYNAQFYGDLITLVYKEII